jgi:hypothetical protein
MSRFYLVHHLYRHDKSDLTPELEIPTVVDPSYIF